MVTAKCFVIIRGMSSPYDVASDGSEPEFPPATFGSFSPNAPPGE
jgi:hypothetical protein